MTSFKMKNPVLKKAQKGAITMFSAILILILLTEMVIYALQVGVFEQRKSGNEVRQKQAFHIADSGISQAKQFLMANAVLASSDVVDQLPDGSDGWLSGTSRWKPCSGVTGTSGTHPCFGEPVAALRAGSYFYDVGSVDFNGDPNIVLDANASPVGAAERLNMYALLCMLDIDRNQDPVVQGCTTDPTKQDFRYFMITLLARGEADCIVGNTPGPDDCTAQALIVDKIGSFGPGGGDGGPGAPLTARTNVPLSGTVEIVPNPNGGGIGVPISSWVNTNTSCPPPGGGDPISPISGSYATCERQEWYGVDKYPADYKCPTSNCACNKAEDKLICYAQGNDRHLGIDIVPDDGFPCDLFNYSFGIDRSNYLDLKALVPPTNRLTDCSSLGPNSFGFYWVSGTTCSLKDQIGSVNAPVFLISAAADTKVSAGAELFGVLFVTNVEVPDAEFTGNGHATIYGAAVMDATMEHFNGTFQIVYLENVIGRAYDTGNFGAVAGGWTDFHAAWQ